jgi:DNA-binding MarR family transcriptional regulator/GNAT superfamily N-acetyltransferase
MPELRREKVSSVVAEVRAFNRFYTREIGVLRETFLDAGLSLPEVRVLYEIAHGQSITASSIGTSLAMDAGYLSRILQKLKSRRMIAAERSSMDARQVFLTLTHRGKQKFSVQNARQNEEVENLLSKLTPEEQQHLVASMRTIQRTLGSAPRDPKRTFILRGPRLGDMGWVIFRHGEGYANLYGWDERFEALVARVAGEFESDHDPARERCWIAERDGERMGCIFLVKHPEQMDVAKLRLLWVEPAARGIGLGKALVQECTRFARQAGYKKIVLWTNSELKSARDLYEREGYKLVRREPHPMFPKPQLAEEWELAL